MTQTYNTSPEAIAEIERRVLALQAEGAKRISVRRVIEEVRHDLHLQINANEQTLITDALLERYPDLPIETRKRGTRGRNKADKSDLGVFAHLLATTSLSVESVTLSHGPLKRTIKMSVIRDWAASDGV